MTVCLCGSPEGRTVECVGTGVLRSHASKNCRIAIRETNRRSVYFIVRKWTKPSPYFLLLSTCKEKLCFRQPEIEDCFGS